MWWEEEGRTEEVIDTPRPGWKRYYWDTEAHKWSELKPADLRLDEIEQCLARLDWRMESAAKTTEPYEERLDAAETRMAAIEHRLRLIEACLAKTGQDQ